MSVVEDLEENIFLDYYLVPLWEISGLKLVWSCRLEILEPWRRSHGKSSQLQLSVGASLGVNWPVLLAESVSIENCPQFSLSSNITHLSALSQIPEIYLPGGVEGRWTVFIEWDQACWHMVVVSALWKQKQDDVELDFRLGCIVNSRLAWSYEANSPPSHSSPQKSL